MKIAVLDLIAYAVGFMLGDYLYSSNFNWGYLEFVALAFSTEKVLGWLNLKWENVK